MNETDWYSNRRTLVLSFLFAIGFHAALFAFVRHFPTFGKLKVVSPPKLTVHLSVRRPVKAAYDVSRFKPARFFPEVPPPPGKIVPEKPKKVVSQKPKKIVKPKVVKKPRKKEMQPVKKKVAPPPSPKEPGPRKSEEPWANRAVESSVPTTYTPRVSASSAKPPSSLAPQGPPTPPRRVSAYPDYARNPSLTYPPLARRRGVEGRVLLKVLVSKTGRPLKMVLERSSGSSILDKAALKAVKHWIFKPGMLNGAPADMWVRVPVVYRLK